jgi:hypothetical protein
MFSTGSKVHLWNPNKSKQRVLVEGRVESIIEAGAVLVVRFDEPAHLEPGASVQLYAEFRNKFHQQGASVRTIVPKEDGTPDDSDTPAIELVRIGEPVSAESRGSYRVATTVSDIFSTIGYDPKTKKQQVVDVSPEGFAVLMPMAPTTGATLGFRWEYAGFVVEGEGRVQTIKPTKGGAFRVGLMVTDKKSPARKSLEKLAIVLQREQLKRMGRAA